MSWNTYKRNGLNMGLKTAAALLMTAFAAMTSETARAQTSPPATAAQEAAFRKYAKDIHLAYIRTSSTQINNDAQRGLEEVAYTLGHRTSIEPKGVVGLDIENDELAFFPFIYWPVTGDARPLSEQAQRKVQNYLNTGGLILFDQAPAAGNASALRRMLGGISIDLLSRINVDHALTKSFYLVAALPGTTNYSPVWVEAPGTPNAENVSSVIIGDKNWAGAWAGRTLESSSQEREMALRAGANMVYYAITGNYKTDMVHVPSILQRLNRNPNPNPP
jgi:hypothetical protein